jgi:hypothetical protein
VLEIALKSLEGGTEMIGSATTEPRELAHRNTNGIEVTLLWIESTNTVAITVFDTHSDEELEFEVEGPVPWTLSNIPTRTPPPFASAAPRRRGGLRLGELTDQPEGAPPSTHRDRGSHMYNLAFPTVIADARIEDLRRARGTLRHPHSARADSNSRPAARWGVLSGAGTRRLVFADPSRANRGPRS